MDKYVICDLDGTLCDHTHRIHFSWSGDWDQYNSLCEYDSYNNSVLYFLFNLVNDKNYNIIFLTGRSEKVEKETRGWLNRYFPGGYHLLMREEYNYTPAAEFKKTKLLNSGFNFENIHYAIDDDESCVEMFKSMLVKKVIHFKG